ncbi:hypothetical protein L3X38_001063 [Prunus dulcis]|uniref:Uncharacterized protein n=1 Tax=Prunus dulcis TaxID=3755 RepID=A0AAD4WRY7_PRUDU|nr:hypothetical protein L3X38_001063 [Prunus dulcis]
MSVKKERETTRHEEKLLQCDSCFARFNASMTAIDPRSDPFKRYSLSACSRCDRVRCGLIEALAAGLPYL